ncbi:reverse transcriptase domain-containing protein [Sporosalibacterium faouarense]|uniref:reverse transcriptase domain-containing protein n=1 Tax=Sporosalibacterium faouarense TaxID=516123 RepID=UPI001FAED22C|nr:reverse transcriptase domain-containing protein [Sporosalibacterium faouarense]
MGLDCKEQHMTQLSTAFKLLSKQNSPEWILEGDIKGCFDNISHKWLMNNILIDKKVLNQWLKAGLVYKGEWFPTEAGTSQGGLCKA